jgi:hypothetical protein
MLCGGFSSRRTKAVARHTIQFETVAEHAFINTKEKTTPWVAAVPTVRILSKHNIKIAIVADPQKTVL